LRRTLIQRARSFRAWAWEDMMKHKFVGRRTSASRLLLMASGTLLVSLAGGALPAQAQSGSSQIMRSYDIPAQPLRSALRDYMRQSGVQVGFPSEIGEHVTTSTVTGSFSAAEALSRLLTGTGLTYRFTGANTATLERAPQAAAGAIQLGPVRVEGSDGTSGVIFDETANRVPDSVVATRSATGTKTDAPLIETPQSISVITATEIRDRASESVKDAVRYSAGVHVGGSSGSIRSFDNVEVRGFAPTPLYLNGIYLPYIGDLGGSPQIDPYLLEKVEVLKGPTSVLYGQNYPGGIVNMTTKRPTPEAIGEVVARTSNRGQAYGAFDLSGPLDTGAGLFGRVTGVASTTGTIVDHVQERRLLIAPSLAWQPDEDTNLTLIGHYQRDRGRPDYQPLPYVGTVVPAGSYGRISRSLFSGEPGYNDYRRDQWAIGYEATHRFNDAVTIRANGLYLGVDDRYRTFFAGGYVTAADNTPDYTQMRRNATDYASNNTVFGADTKIEAHFTTGAISHETLVGVDYRWFDNDYTGRYGFGNTTLNPFRPVYGSYNEPRLGARWDNQVEQIGLYVQDRMRLGPVVLTLGGRQDWAATDNDDLLTGIRTTNNDRAFTGRVGMTYIADNGLAPYFSYATSFMPYAGFDGESRPFKPTTGKQYEAGVKFQPKTIDALVTVSIYDLRQQNVPTYDFFTYLPTQRGEIHVQGIEFEGKLALRKRLDLIASASYTNSVYSKATDGTEGNKVRFMPPWQAALWAKYDLSSVNLFGISAGVGVRYSGSGYGDDMNTFKYPSYTVFDGSLTYDLYQSPLHLAGAEFSVVAENLFDRKYVSGCSNINNCYYGKARLLTASLRYHW